MKERFAGILQLIRKNSSHTAAAIFAIVVAVGVIYSLSHGTIPVLEGLPAAQNSRIDISTEQEVEELTEMAAETEQTETTETVAEGSFDLEDGIYTGSAEGFSGQIKVSVEIKDHAITEIKILENADDAAFFNRAKEGIISKILASQSTQVDTVSGATFSSKGIINAVKSALSMPTTSQNEKKNVTIGTGNFSLEDGFYEGVGNGYAGEIKVLLEIKDHSITQIIIMKTSDDENFFNRAKEGVTAAILEKQTADVDCVSGATYSSRGIIEAVKAALTGEKKDDNKKVTIGQGDFKLKNGVYEGSGSGFHGTINVAVVVKDASIIAVEPYEFSDDTTFFERAKEGVTTTILEKQTVNVDTVAGATYSSKGILAAVTDAIKKGESSPKDSNKNKANENPVTYKDGTYTGSADGFSGKIKVKVRIKNGKIKKITILSHSDTEEYMNKAKALTKRIVSAQNTDLDAVSGATYSSNGILKAVENALKKAVEEKKTEEDTDSSDTTQDQITPVTGTFDYPDGIYQGVGTGFGGDIKVSVVILDKTIKVILITEHAGEDDNFFNRAKTITTTMTETQNINVDAVSGATLSSNGIIEAVKAAIEAAKNGTTQTPEDDTKKPEDTTTPTDTTQERTYIGMVICEPDESEDFTPYNLYVRVTIQNGKVTAVTDVYGDGDTSNSGFITRAVNGSSKNPGVAAQIVSKNQAEGIDTISGATCTSKALIKAVKLLLTAAEKDGCYSVNKDVAAKAADMAAAEAQQKADASGAKKTTSEKKKTAETKEQKKDRADDDDDAALSGGDENTLQEKEHVPVIEEHQIKE